MYLSVNCAASMMLASALVLLSAPVNAQDEGGFSPRQPAVTNPPEAQDAPAEATSARASSLSESAQQAPSSLTSDQQSTAKKVLCNALAGHYKNAASAGVSGLTDPQVLLTGATNYSSAMHVPFSSATELLKGFATQHASEILTSCAVTTATQGVPSTIPSIGSVNSRSFGLSGVP
jgi:hypothetical protein